LGGFGFFVCCFFFFSKSLSLPFPAPLSPCSILRLNEPRLRASVLPLCSQFRRTPSLPLLCLRFLPSFRRLCVSLQFRFLLSFSHFAKHRYSKTPPPPPPPLWVPVLPPFQAGTGVFCSGLFFLVRLAYTTFLDNLVFPLNAFSFSPLPFRFRSGCVRPLLCLPTWALVYTLIMTVRSLSFLDF